MKLGAGWPQQLLGKDKKGLAAYFQALEEMGYDFIGAGDHVLGADRSQFPDWKPYFGKPPLWVHTDPFHEPLVLFGYLGALTEKLELSTLFLLPQRQAALAAKQAAQADFLTNGRIRLICANGWNDLEYEALGMDFKNRGSRMEEQITLMRELWTKEVVTFKGKWHTVRASGINPLPVRRPIPVWFGGASERVLKRTGRMGDGFNPWYPFFNEARIKSDWEAVQQHAREAGRDPKSIGYQTTSWSSDYRFEPGPGDRWPVPTTMDSVLKDIHWFKEIGATHFSVSLPWVKQGSSIDERLNGYCRFKEALGKNF